MAQFNIYKKVLKQVTEAYDRRKGNLDFYASHYVTRDQAIKICELAIGQYNEFKPEVLLELPKNAQVLICREGSVCMYVRAKKMPSLRALAASEHFKKGDGYYRVWWD